MASDFAALEASLPPSPPLGSQITSVEEAFLQIKELEKTFPLATEDETITIGTIDVFEQSLGTGFNRFRLANGIDRYEDGSTHKTVRPAESDESTHGTAIIGNELNFGPSIAAANVKVLSVRILINWAKGREPLDLSAKIRVTVGSDSREISRDTSELVFGLTDGNQFSFTIEDLVPNGVPVWQPRPGLLNLQVDRHVTFLSGIVIPVLPISIVYAPAVDFAKQNKSSLTESMTTGTTLTLGLSKTNSNSAPQLTEFQSIEAVTKNLATIGSLLTKIDQDGPTAIVGKAFMIADAVLRAADALFGSTSTTSGMTITTSTLNSTQESVTTTLVQSSLASQGGPGVGDIITYYYNVRVVLYADGDKVSATILGAEGFATPTAGELSQTLIALANQPIGFIDPTFHVDLAAAQGLVALDPFVSGGEAVDLDPTRFSPVTQPLTIGGGARTLTLQHTLTTTDLQSAVQTENTSQTDSPGLLSFLGVGPTDAQTFQVQLTQSNSTQSSVGRTISQSVTLNGDAIHPYKTEIYLDSVFGTFAFRQLPVA